jgi:tetratricopeptide (TPR) repeat protein
MSKEPEQPVAAGHDLFDEIEMDPIEIEPIEVVAEVPAAVEKKGEDGVEWVVKVDVVKVDDNRTAQTQTAQSTTPSTTPSTRELMERETLIPTRKLQNRSESPVLENGGSKPGRPGMTLDKDEEDVEEIKRMLAEIEKLEQKEVPNDSNSLPPPPEKPKVVMDTSSVDIKKLLADLSELEQQNTTKPAKPLPSEKPRAGQGAPSRSTQRLSLPELDSLEQKETSKPARSQDSSGKLRALQENESSNPEDVQKILAELDKMEQEEATKPSKPLIAPSKPRQTAPLNADDNSDLKQTLAEMSFLEGHESLSKGDRSGAIVHYRDAVSYAPERVDYYKKLADLLGQEGATKAEAEQLLTKAIELAPNNMELRSKLAELRGEVPAATKRGTQNLSTGGAQAGGQEQKEKTAKLSRFGFITGEVVNHPKKISLINKAILILFFGVLIWGVIFSMRGEPIKIQVRLLLPPDEASISQDRLELAWQATGDKFKIQIEENGIPLMERITVETRYNLPPEDLSLFKPDRRYTWRVIPLNFNNEVIPNITDDFHFKVAALSKGKKSVEATAEPTKRVEFPGKRISRTKKPTKKVK